MKRIDLTRRQFITTTSATALAASARQPVNGQAITAKGGKLAILGGAPVRKDRPWPDWPHWDDKVVDSVVKTTKSRIWCRIQAPQTGAVATFEKEYAKLLGSKFCVATGAGTQALHTCLEALEIGPGDEVITSPFTDPGTIASILSSKALPVLADLDPPSFQLDAKDVERRITPNTRAIMPVHIMGQPCELGAILEIAKKRGLRVIEDACQAHLSVYRGKRLGTHADLGCFSFQSSKILACGEGGAIVGDDPELMDKCYTVHNHGTSRRGDTEVAGPKYRMNEFEAAVLLAQLPGLEERFRRRNENAAYLTARLKEIPGLVPQKLYEGTESGSFYIYGMTYKKEYFNDASRGVFLKAVAAEGAPISGYITRGLHREKWVDRILGSKVYQKMYGQERLERYRAETQCPNCDRVCHDVVIIWASGPLLAAKQDMDDIVNAVVKVHANRDQLKQVS